MKKTLILSLLAILTLALPAKGQLVLQYESFGKSSFRDKVNNSSNKQKGSSNVYSGALNLPISVKMKDERPQVWSVAVSGAYASLNNHGFTSSDLAMPLDKILNLNLNVMHLRPLTKQLSLMMSVGVGAFLPDSRLSALKGGNILGNGGAILIWHLRPNLDLGAGLALTNTFGHPMVLPIIYLDWRLDGKFKVRVSMINGLDLLAGYSPKKYVDLNIVVGMSGQMALLKIDGKNMIFSHQYITAGFQPTFNITKRISIPITIGINAQRSAYYTRRSLKGFFSDDDNESYFKQSFYISTALKINLF